LQRLIKINLLRSIVLAFGGSIDFNLEYIKDIAYDNSVAPMQLNNKIFVTLYCSFKDL